MHPECWAECWAKTWWIHLSYLKTHLINKSKMTDYSDHCWFILHPLAFTVGCTQASPHTQTRSRNVLLVMIAKQSRLSASYLVVQIIFGLYTVAVSSDFDSLSHNLQLVKALLGEIQRWCYSVVRSQTFKLHFLPFSACTVYNVQSDREATWGVHSN